MAKRPVPSLIHRTTTKQVCLGGVTIAQGERVVLGLVSATAERNFTDVTPVFGGDYAAKPKPIHACPGSKLGFGTLLGMISALFETGGSLRRATSPSALQFNAALLDPYPAGEEDNTC